MHGGTAKTLYQITLNCFKRRLQKWKDKDEFTFGHDERQWPCQFLGEDQPGKLITDLTEIANRGLIVDRYFTSPYAFAGHQIPISGINIEFVNVTLIAIKVLTCGLWLI